jgi:hypothetical protein
MRPNLTLLTILVIAAGLTGSITRAQQCELHEGAKLTASDAAAVDWFGQSVSLSGDTAIVGALFNDDACPAANPDCDSGSAYVYVHSSGVWPQRQRLTALDAAAGANFGGSVAVDGDTAVVGAREADHAGVVAAGSAYVFVRADGVWTQQQKLTAPNPATGEGFGQSVSVMGDTVVVGAAYTPALGGPPARGSAYVFRYHPDRPPESRWVEEQQLTPSDSAPDDHFGFRVSVSGDTAVVGAHTNDHAGADSGAAYVFVRPFNGWAATPFPMTETAKLVASDAAAGDIFGDAVSVDGDTIVVGAMRNDDACPANPACQSGSAYVFVKPASGWVDMTETAKLTASDAAAEDDFGVSVSLSGNIVVVGAFQPPNEPGSGSGAGSVYVFVKPAGGWPASPSPMTETAKLTASDAAAGDQFGCSVSVSGETVVVGANFDDDAGTNSGSAYVFDLGCHDADGDGYGSPGNCSCSNGGALDCNDNNPHVYPGAPDICDGIDNQCPGDPGYGQVDEGPPACDDGNACTRNDTCGGGVCSGTPINAPPDTQNVAVAADKATYSWSAATDATQYDVVRGSTGALPVGVNLADEACFDNLAGTALVDPELPAPGAGFWYLSRGENACGIGTFGNQSDGSPRITTTCP